MTDRILPRFPKKKRNIKRKTKRKNRGFRVVQ